VAQVFVALGISDAVSGASFFFDGPHVLANSFKVLKATQSTGSNQRPGLILSSSTGTSHGRGVAVFRLAI